MKTEELLAALGQLEELYIQEADCHIHSRKKKNWARWGAVAAAVILFFAGAAGTAMAASAEFRQMVLSFFHIEQTESVPDPNNEDFVLTESDIGGQVKAEYIPLKGNNYSVGLGTFYQVDKTKNGTIRSVRFWSMEDGNTLHIDAQKNSFQTVWQNETYQGDIYWCVYNGELSLYANDTSNSVAKWHASSIPGRADAVLLYLSQGAYQEYRQYPIIYHLDTGEMEDILQNTGVEELPYPNAYQWSLDLSKVLVTCSTTEDENALYLCDVSAKTLSPLQNYTGVKCSNAYFADNNTLILLQITEGKCSVFTYNLTTLEVAQTFQEATLWEDNGTKPFSGDGMMFFGGRYGLYVDPTGNLSVLDFKTGAKHPVNGFTFDENGNFLSNISNTKLLYSVTDCTTDESLRISELGVLDLQTGVFTSFERKGYENLTEWSLGWFDEHRAVIQSGDPDLNALYLYSF